MPIDWGSRETIFRLLAAAFAVIGKEGFRGTYGEIAKLFGEPATYDAIQCQFREVSKMADGLRAGQAGTPNRSRSVKLPRPVRRPARSPPKLDSSDLEVIAQSQEAHAPDRVPGLEGQDKDNQDTKTLRAVHRRSRVRTSPPPPPPPPQPSSSSPLTSSLKESTGPPSEEDVRIRAAPQAPKLIHKADINPDRVDMSQHRVMSSSSSADEPASASQPPGAEEYVRRSSLNHAEERAQFRKLYSSDSHGTQAEHVNTILSQSCKEHAAERGRFRNLYYSDNGKDATSTPQDILKASSATPVQYQQEEKDEAPVANATVQNQVLETSRAFGRNAEKTTTADGVDLVKHLTEHHERDIFPLSAASSSRGHQNSGIPGASYMHAGSRKCLLCNRRFPGEAFEKHERGSARHRENLRDKEAVAKANERLKKIQGLELSERKEVEPASAAEDASEQNGIHRSPPQSYDERCPEDSRASSPHYYSRSISLTPIRLESSVPPHGKFKSPNVKRSREESEDELFSRAPDEHDLRVTKGDESPPPLKRQCRALEPQVGESSTQAKVNHSNRNAKNARARDDILIEISGAALDKLLELHPEIFELDLNRRTTPAPPRRQAMGPPNKPTPRESMERRGDHWRANVGEEIHGDGIGAGFRSSSATSRDYVRYSSRCDDPQDMDYLYEEDEKMLVEDEEEDQEEEVEEEEILELLQC